ncbi:MAG: DUF2225 domain-containing protein [Suilimivivens sp.]
MAGLLSGLGKLGLKNLENADLYEQPEENKEEVKEKESAKPEKMKYQEESFLFNKSYECPVCYKSFKEKTVRAGKLRSMGTDKDLRPIYEQMEPLKYDVILCPYCGYATLTRFFGGLTASQIKAIRENISAGFQSMAEDKAVYTYEEALNRYKLCLANTIVKHGKASEKAYICLKAGWLLRSMGEELDEEDADYDKKLGSVKEQEKEFLKNALEGFITARQSESYPICGMDEITLEYLIAVLAMEFGQYEVASKLISNILASPSANHRTKDRARDIKEELLVKIREKKAGQ